MSEDKKEENKMKKEFNFQKTQTAGEAAVRKSGLSGMIKLIIPLIAVCYHLAFLPGTLPLNGLTYLINLICTVITIYNIITRI